MNLEQMKEIYVKAKVDYELVTSPLARRGIAKELNALKDKIDDEERRLSSRLRVKNIDGIDYEIPNSFGYEENSEKYTYEIKDGCLYRFENMNRKIDGSFHLYHHVWIPQTTNKYVELIVRVLGDDDYGERYYLDAYYYKHPSDKSPYLHKSIHCQNYAYRPYYLYVFDKMGLKQKKDKWDGNRLEWID